MAREVSVTLKANISRFEKNLDRAVGRLQSAGKRMQSLGGTLSKTLTPSIAAAGAASFELARRAGNTADELLDLESQTGLTTEEIQQYRFVAQQAGVDQDAMTQAAQDLTNRLGRVRGESSPAAEALSELGMSAFDAQGNVKDADDVFRDLVPALAEMENASKRNRIATQLFGGAWRDVAPILDQGEEGINRLKNEFDELGLGLESDQIEAANSFRKSLASLSAQLSNMFTQIGAELAPVLEEQLLPVIQDNIIPAIQSLSQRVISVIEWFGNLSSRSQGLIAAVTSLAAAIGPVLAGMGTLVKLMAPAVGVLKAVAAAFSAKAAVIAGPVIAAIVAIKRNFSNIVDFFANNFTPVVNSVSESFRNIMEAMGLSAQNNIGGVRDVFMGLLNTLVSIMESVGRVIGDALNFVANQFDSTINLIEGIVTGDWMQVFQALQDIALEPFRFIGKAFVRLVGTLMDGAAAIGDAFGLSIGDSIREAKKEMEDFVGISNDIEEQNIETSNSAKEAAESNMDLKDSVGELTEAKEIANKRDQEITEQTKERRQEDLNDFVAKQERKKEIEQANMERFEADNERLNEMMDQRKEWQNELAENTEDNFEKIGDNFLASSERAIESADSMKKAAKGIASAASDAISAMISEGVTAIVKGTLQSYSNLGPAAIPIAAAAGSAASALFNAAIPKFAEGGVVRGETLGIMGEFPGAASNPEVVAPLSKLENMLTASNNGESGVGQRDVKFALSGSDAEAIVTRSEKTKKRLGI